MRDLDGVGRPLDGDYTGAALWDIGAYEYVHVSADSDGDGMPDFWEAGSGLNPASSQGEDGAGADPDDDGAGNLAEFAADTDPRDGESVLELTGIWFLGEALRVAWKGGEMSTQFLEMSTGPSLGGPGWSPILTNDPPTPVINDSGGLQVTNRGAFFRIRAVR
jgi:hypothetical protein